MTNAPYAKRSNDVLLDDVYGDTRLIAGILFWFVTLIIAGLIAGIFILLSNDNVLPAIIVASSLPFVFASYYFIRRQRYEPVVIYLTVYLMVLNTFLSTNGLGIHNLSNISYPAILIVAGLVGRKRTMTFLTLFAIGCVAWLVFGELSGMYTPHVLVHSVPGDFFSMAVILVITALMVNRLFDALRKSFQRLNREFNERKSVENDLRQREAILEAVTFAAEQFLKTPDWRENIDNVLARLGKTINATHAYLFEDHLNSQGDPVTSMRYEWTAAGYPSDLDGPYFQSSSIRQSGFEEQVEKLKQGEVRMGRVSTFNPIEKEIMSEQGVKAILEVPISVNGREWGAIGFDDFENEREWSMAEVDALKIAAGVLGTAIQRQKADSAVQESERIYRQAIETAGAVPYYQDYKFDKYQFMGQGIQKITGYAPEEMSSSFWSSIVQETELVGDLAGLKDANDAARRVRSGEFDYWKCDYRIRAKDGQSKWIAVSAIELFDDSGASYGSIGIMQDITERKQIEAGLREREAILEAMTFAAEQFLKSSDWRLNIDCVLKRLGETFHATHAYLFEHFIDAHGVEQSLLKYEWTAAGCTSDFDDPKYQTPKPINLDPGSTDHDLMNDRVFSGNVSTFPPAERDRLLGMGVKAMVEVPLFVDGKWWGTFGLDDLENEREWSLAEMDALRIAAGILGAAIRRQKAESAVRESERIYRQAIEAAGAIPYYRDYINHRYAFMGEGIAEITGYSASEMTPQIWGRLQLEGYPRGRVAHLTYEEALRLTEEGVLHHWECDYRIVNRYGRERWIADTSVQVLDDKNARIGVVGILQDITARKLTEFDLRKRESLLEAITFSAEQFLKAPDWRDRISVVLERIGREFNASHAYLFERHPGPDGGMLNSMRYEWAAPGQKPDLDNPAYQNAPEYEKEFKRYYEILDRGDPFVGSASYMTHGERSWLNGVGIKALLEMRIVVDGKQWGTIGFDDMVNEREWTTMEADVIKVAANVLGAAIKRQLDEDALKHELAERKRAEQKYRDIFNNSMEGIFQSTEDGRFLSVNPAMAHIYGYASPEEMLLAVSDIGVQVYVNAGQRDEVKQRLSSGERLAGYESLEYRRDGSTFWSSMSAQAIRDENGKILYYEGTMEDITPRKKAETEREALIQELAKKNAELEQFTYTVSHDLKSPLVTINGFLGYLEQDALSGNMGRLKKDMQRIQEAVHKMQRLLNELLELSRIGRMMNDPETIPFNELVKEALDIVHGRLEKSGASVQVQPDLPAVHGDRPRLVEVVQNLVDNAAKYMGDQKEPRIEIGQRGNENGMPVFYVKDNGMGIEPEHHERVFGLFNKLDARSEGTGVGLALVKRIVEFHGGRIRVESEAGSGSTFLFTLPPEGSILPDPKPDSVI